MNADKFAVATSYAGSQERVDQYRAFGIDEVKSLGW